LLAASPAVATPASGFSAVQQIKGMYGELDVKGDKTGSWDVKLTTKDVSDVWIVRNSIAPGGQSGWHRHPGPSLITVTIGEITAYDSSDPLCSPKVYRTGEGFVDLGDHAHLLKNETAAAAETVAVQLLPTGAQRRIDVDPAPNNCSF
jgi:quercetin dioxygenase-like cupin family protein